MYKTGSGKCRRQVAVASKRRHVLFLQHRNAVTGQFDGCASTYSQYFCCLSLVTFERQNQNVYHFTRRSVEPILAADFFSTNVRWRTKIAR
jgi:hypothetical protein